MLAIHYASLLVYLCYPAADAVAALVAELGVPLDEAERLYDEAVARHERLEEAERERLDSEALRAEHDLAAEPADEEVPWSPHAETTIRWAFAFAQEAYYSLGVPAHGLLAMVVGAFTLPLDTAAKVVEAVVEEEEPWAG